MKKYGKDYRKAAGGYEYTGNWYKTALTGDALKKEARFFWICLAVMSVQFVLGLSLNNAGSRILWILLPFVALFLPLFYGWLGSAKLYSIGKRLEQEPLTRKGGASRRNSTQKASAKELHQTGSTRQRSVHSEKTSGTGKVSADSVTSADPQVQIPEEHKSHLRRSEYEQSFRRLLRSFVAGAVLSNAVFLADILVLVGNTTSGSVAGEAVFAGNAAILAALNLICAAKSWKVHASVREE